MYKIAITGKANSGKNTVSKLLTASLLAKSKYRTDAHYIAFADPIKKMIRLSFPQVPRKWLYGSSKYRTEIIPGAFKDGKPLTVRQLLIDLGNDFGRKYKSDLWICNFDHSLAKLEKKNPAAIIVTDCRFRNEFDHLKELGFCQIRLLRDSHTKINDISETNQDTIRDDEYDFVIHNNDTLESLKARVQEITAKIQQ
jgi:hypothetical protein